MFNLVIHGVMNEMVYVPVVCKLDILYLLSDSDIPSKPCLLVCYASNPISRDVFFYVQSCHSRGHK